MSLSVTNRTCLVLECCQVFIEQQQYQIATFDLTRTCSWCFLIRLKHVCAILPSSYCMRLDGKMCNLECTLLDTCIPACSQVSHSFSSSLLTISSTYRMSLLTPTDHSHLARHPFFVLSPTDPVGTVTCQSPTGQTTFTLFHQQCRRSSSQSRHGTITN